MSDELTDLRARLEALAEKWVHAAAMCNSTTAQEAWGEATATAATQLRALLAAPAPVAEPPKCEECESCEEGDRGYWFCELTGDRIFTERKEGRCGPSGRRFKRRVTT